MSDASGSRDRSSDVAAALGGGVREPGSAEALLRRRLFPLSVAILLTLGIAEWIGEHAGLVARGPGLLLTMGAGAAAISTLTIWAAQAVRRLERERAALGRRYQRLVEQLPLVVYAHEVSGGSATIYASPQVEEVLGYPSADWIEDPHLFVKRLHPGDRARVLSGIRAALDGGSGFRSEYRLIARDGREVWMQDERVIVRDEEGTPLYAQGYLLDVTERKLAEERLEQLAYTDMLTGLPNREHFLGELAIALAEGHTEVSIVFLDLDDFKTVNDSLGHAAGDELLRAVGERLGVAMRESDHVARLGGDEFGIIVRTADRRRLTRLAERIQLALQSTTVVAGTTARMAASIGIARGGDSRDLLRDADTAMYAAKAAGGDTFRFFEPAMHEAAVERQELMAALEHTDVLGELRLEYQPTFDLVAGQILTVEALLRWDRPGHGPVPPRHFLPLAEQTGAILGIGRWVLAQSCRQVAAWNRGREGHPPLALTVNVSWRQLASPEVVADVASALSWSGLAAELLTLELAETVLMKCEGVAADNLARLKRLGVRLAIDDFGSGHSFSYLRRLPVDVIKIDRSFVNRLDSQTDEALVRGMVGLAQELGAELVAEGIEREAQINLLRELPCRHGQGFLLAPPCTPAELVPLLEADRPEALRLRAVGG